MSTIEQQALELYPDSAEPVRQYRQELQRAAYIKGHQDAATLPGRLPLTRSEAEA